ncbi:transcriptional regulator, IclR family [Tistlia consotensis]|uniref:Transcriptional regulator, IclR family n=1 Tax=Tistlia consotensis USBA 355 TaxID=560819 RepID=A0A1Y6BXL1_9PROT|nr:IclR family transcriptional regulator [Tistlia consotensis]SMF30461.1 transcriptional regulator, IclR family [Tistlia consotensis USBA 355]SNR89995.1 transcriptional regulator, IclR family [Tistlia consotensis]
MTRHDPSTDEPAAAPAAQARALSGAQGPSGGEPSGELGGKPVGAVLHAVRLLQVLADSPGPLGVTAAARQARVNPSTAFQILRTLVRGGLVAFDPALKAYSPGLGLLALSRSLLGRDYTDLLRPELVRLATNHECLFALWRLADERAVLIDRALADTPVRLDIQVTQRIPSLIGAVGRVVAARLALPEDELRRRFSHLRWQTPLSFEDYLREVEEARGCGYGLDLGNLYTGIHSAAAVVCDDRARPFLGISAITLAQSSPPDRLRAMGEELAALCRTASGIPGR